MTLKTTIALTLLFAWNVEAQSEDDAKIDALKRTYTTRWHTEHPAGGGPPKDQYTTRGARVTIKGGCLFKFVEQQPDGSWSEISTVNRLNQPTMGYVVRVDDTNKFVIVKVAWRDYSQDHIVYTTHYLDIHVDDAVVEQDQSY